MDLNEEISEVTIEEIFAKVDLQDQIGRWLPTRVSTRDLEWDVAADFDEEYPR